MKTNNINNNSERENKAVMENVSDMSNDELLAMVANELENGGKQDEPGARFKIGDRVRMKHDGATGTIARVWDGYDGFSYEVTRDVPIEGLEPGSEVWEAFPQESGLEPLEPASEITDGEAVGVLHYGTMVRMPGVVGGLKVAEIDREGDRVICKSDGEQHEYKSIAYFEQTAQEIIIPRWLRIMKYFYIGPKDKEENRVLCTAIEPNNDPEHPVVIHYNVDGEDEDSKIVLTSGLDYYNRENPTDPDGSGKPTLESVGEITDQREQTQPGLQSAERERAQLKVKAVCIEGVSLTAEKRQKWVKNFGDIIREHTTMGKETQYNHDCGCIRVTVAYRNDSDKPEDWTYCVAWYKWLDIVTEKRELVECENGVRLEQAARAMADFHLLADAGLSLRQSLYPAA